jgi:hypothetical protein
VRAGSAGSAGRARRAPKENATASLRVIGPFENTGLRLDPGQAAIDVDRVGNALMVERTVELPSIDVPGRASVEKTWRPRGNNADGLHCGPGLGPELTNVGKTDSDAGGEDDRNRGEEQTCAPLHRPGHAERVAAFVGGARLLPPAGEDGAGPFAHVDNNVGRLLDSLHQR